jgi:hypothetical protein
MGLPEPTGGVDLVDNRGLYSTERLLSDDYLDLYFTEILQERDLDYQPGYSLDILSYRKAGYHATPNYFDLPGWVVPAFSVDAFYQLSGDRGRAYFHSGAIKRSLKPLVDQRFILFQAPIFEGHTPEVSFLLDQQNQSQLHMIKPH